MLSQYLIMTCKSNWRFTSLLYHIYDISLLNTCLFMHNDQGLPSSERTAELHNKRMFQLHGCLKSCETKQKNKICPQQKLQENISPFVYPLCIAVVLTAPICFEMWRFKVCVSGKMFQLSLNYRGQEVRTRCNGP